MATRDAIKKVKDLQQRDLGASILMKIAEQVTSEDIAVAIAEMLVAMKYERVSKTETQLVPDWTARANGIRLYLGYQIGLPVQRQVIIQQSDEAPEATLDRIMASPTARKWLAKLLHDADKMTGSPAGAGKAADGASCPVADDDD